MPKFKPGDKVIAKSLKHTITCGFGYNSDMRNLVNNKCVLVVLEFSPSLKGYSCQDIHGTYYSYIYHGLDLEPQRPGKIELIEKWSI